MLLFGRSWPFLGQSWPLFKAILAALGTLARLGVHLGSKTYCCSCVLPWFRANYIIFEKKGRPRAAAILRPSWAVLALSWAVLGLSWAVLERPMAASGGSSAVMGQSLADSGRSWGALGTVLGGSWLAWWSLGRPDSGHVDFAFGFHKGLAAQVARHHRQQPTQPEPWSG